MNQSMVSMFAIPPTAKAVGFLAKGVVNYEIRCNVQRCCNWSRHGIEKDIVDVIINSNSIDAETKIYDLCCGSGAISIEMVNRCISPSSIIMVDSGPWGGFWMRVGDGTFSIYVFEAHINNTPKDICEIKSYVERIANAKMPVGDDMVYKYIILQASSFGGKAIWEDGGRWQNTSFRNHWMPTGTSKRRSPTNPMMPMPKTLFDRVRVICEKMLGAVGIRCDVSRINSVGAGNIIHIDPPYKESTVYGSRLSTYEFIDIIKKNNPGTESVPE